MAEKLFPAYSAVAAMLITVALVTALPRLLGLLGAAGTQLGTVFLYVSLCRGQDECRQNDSHCSSN